VSALGTAAWTFGTAAIPALFPLAILYCRYLWERRQLRLLGERLAGICPVRNLVPGMSFEEALSVFHRADILILLDCVLPV
jgi:hypothetical protein